MGTPIPPIHVPDDVPAGNLCINCWGPEPFFGPGPTPSSIEVTIEGVEKTPAWSPLRGEPFFGTYDVPQVGTCSFELFPFLGDFNSRILVQFAATLTRIQCNTDTFVAFFNVANGVRCTLDHDNDNTPYFENGTVKILLPGIS